MRTILFLTTNYIWGGSEVLWVSVAKKLSEQLYDVRIIAGYEPPGLSTLTEKEYLFFLLKKQPPLLTRQQRMRQRLGWEEYSPQKKLEAFIAVSGASLAILSQGGNTEGLAFMEILAKQHIPYVTITHLVVESFWPGQNDERINRLKSLFDKSVANYFVSEHTLRQHEKFLGYPCANSQITYNPFTKGSSTANAFPSLVNGNYAVALIGRLECYHKGYDLLIEVLASDTWKRRNIIFDIYGSGPHKELMERLIEMNGIQNVFLRGHVENIAEVWGQHHILLMPSRLEGQSLTLTEAMRFKRSAIVTNVGGVKELIEEEVNGFIAEYPSAKAIDEALERAWRKRADWEAMGVNAHQTIITKHPADAVGYFIGQINSLVQDEPRQENKLFKAK